MRKRRAFARRFWFTTKEKYNRCRRGRFTKALVPQGTVPIDTVYSGNLNKKSEVGNFLLSQEAALQVPSADTRLTAGFGMFPGIPTLLWSPTSLFIFPNTIYIPFFPGKPLKTYLFLTPRKSLRSLVPVCSIHYCTFTSGLSSK